MIVFSLSFRKLLENYKMTRVNYLSKTFKKSPNWLLLTNLYPK